MMNEIIIKKKYLRQTLTDKRKLIKKNSTKEFNNTVFNQLIEIIKFDEIKHIGSFISIRSEISTNKLNKKILQMNKSLLLPVIEKNSQELIFKKFDSSKNFKLGKFNIPEPTKDCKEVVPQLFFVPCLGFDLNGYRIGYGGGFYDRYVQRIEKIKKIIKIGLAFSFQKISSVPINQNDKRLDFIITEKEILR